MESIEKLLAQVKDGSISVDEAALELRKAPFKDIGLASIDEHRKIRTGMSEVIYGEGKTASQIKAILKAMDSSAGPVIITRLSPEKAREIEDEVDITYHKDARLAIYGDIPEPDGKGKILVICAGSSDLPVAKEAEITARALGNETELICDVGVAGLHRLLARLDDIMGARVIVAVAGMEGALAGVVGGLAKAPVIAVPTSVGYGAAFDGVAALLGMLNSCASGVSVVNIDNGFGAACQASIINHL